MKINERILRNIIFESINEEFENNDFVSEFFRPEADFQAYEKKDSDKKGKKSDKKKDSDKKEESGGKEMSPEKRKAIEDDLSDFFENDGVNKAAYAYKLFGVEPEEGKDTNDEKNARGLFAKKLDHEKDRSTGYVYSFSSEELNRLESMKNDKLDESRLRNIVGESIKKVLREGIIPKYENPVYIGCNSKEDADISVEIGYSDYSSSLFYVGECGTDGYAALEAVVNYLVENGIIDHYTYDKEDVKDYAIEDFIEVNGYYLPRWEVHIEYQ